MHSLRWAFVCTCTGVLMACSVASLHAVPLPTNAEAMKSMVADGPLQVRWGYWGGWRHRGGPSRSWEWTQEPAAFAFGYYRPYFAHRWRRWRY
jgi:hypothetical protein